MLQNKSMRLKASCNFSSLVCNTSAPRTLDEDDACFTDMLLLTIIYSLKHYCLCMRRTILFSSEQTALQKAPKSSREGQRQQNV